MNMTRMEIATADGIAPATLTLPEGGAGEGVPGVLLYMDVFGPRETLNEMARRYAAEGYAVLVPDLFYRFGERAPVDPKTGFQNADTAAALRGMIAGTTQAMTAADTGAFLAAFESAGVTGPVGVVGYCMGGGRALTAAAAYPQRIVAAASFHGGNLASDAEDSPHRRAGEIAARIYVGTACEDASLPPEQSSRLVDALHRAKVDFTLENYVGVAHGWCMPDHNAFDAAGAERHWRRVLGLFSETLSR